MASAAITGWLFPVLSLAYSLPSQQLSSERLVLPTVQLPHTWALIFSSVLSTAYSVILLLLELFKEQGSLVLSVLYHLVFFRTINFQDYLVLCFSKLCKSLPRWSSHYISSWPCTSSPGPAAVNHFQQLLYLSRCYKSLPVLFFTFLMPVCCSNCVQASPLLGERSMMERCPPLSYIPRPRFHIQSLYFWYMTWVTSAPIHRSS